MQDFACEEKDLKLIFEGANEEKLIWQISRSGPSQ